MALPPLTSYQLKKLVHATLANDEESTDKELIDYFVQCGMTEDAATEIVVKKRDAFLRGPGIYNGG